MATMRPCLGDRSRGCPTGSLIPQGSSRCAECARVVEQGRGTRQERGYDKTHDDLRADYQRRMDRGEPFTCWRCDKPVDPTSWQLGHCDVDRTKHHGPEHVGCNSATAGRVGCTHESHQGLYTGNPSSPF